MESGLPDDLARVRDWAGAAIKAASDLYPIGSTKQTITARAELIELLLDPPQISASLSRELTIASDHYQQEEPACFSGMPARHPLDAIQELCWQVLESSHRQSKAAIQLRIALHRELIAMDASTQREYSRWVKAVAAIERVEQSRAELKKTLPQLDAVVKQFPAPARPLLDPNAPGPSQVICSGDGLDVLLQKVLNRVWSDRLKRQASSQREPSTAQSDSGSRAPKTRSRGRPKKYDQKTDDKVYDAWHTGEFKDRVECAGAFDLSFEDLVNLLGRVGKQRRA